MAPMLTLLLLLLATHMATAAVTAVIVVAVCRSTRNLQSPLSPAHFVALSKEIAAAAWTRRVRAAAKRNGKRRGRPRVPDALERHILQIKRENPSYGKQRIASILSQTVRMHPNSRPFQARSTAYISRFKQNSHTSRSKLLFLPLMISSDAR